MPTPRISSERLRAQALGPGLRRDDARAERQARESYFHGAYTWASWFWRLMVRDEQLLTPEDAVHRLTGQPGSGSGGPIGLLREGARADSHLRSGAFAERGTVYEPNLLAHGMRHVFVNGMQPGMAR